MISLWFSFAGPYFEPLGWALVHFLWQGAIVALLLGAILPCLAQAASSKRYLAGCIGLAIMAICPMATFYLGLRGAISSSNLPDPPTSASIQTGSNPSHASGPDLSLLPFEVDLTTEGTLRPTGAVLEAEPTPVLAAPNGSKQILGWLLLAWAAGVSVLALRLLGSWIWIQRMRSVGTSPISSQWTQSLEALARRLQVSRSTWILQSTQVVVPTLIGWFRPVILLPVGFLTGMPPRQIEAILAHEFAHILRHDYLVNLLQALVETVLFYHPAVWWVSRFIREERENCCDDIAAQVCAKPSEYAHALAALEELRGRQAALTLAANHGSLLLRIKRLAGLPLPLPHFSSGMAFVCLALLLFPWLPRMNQGVAGSPLALYEPPQDNDTEVWGHEFKGLRCRIVPLESSIDAPNPDFAKTGQRFSDSRDLTLGVELKNVSDQPLKLAGVRHGSNVRRLQWESSNKNDAPLLFDLEILNAAGQAIKPPKAAYLEPREIGKTIALIELKPGESRKFTIRPGRFAHPWQYQLPSGAYRCRLTYLGASKDLPPEIEKVAGHSPASIWSGHALSNTVAFDIKPGKGNGLPPEPLWGPEVNGLKAAVELCPGATMEGLGEFVHEAPLGTRIAPIHFVKNVGSETKILISEFLRKGDKVWICRADGKQAPEVQEAHQKREWPRLVRVELKPNEVVILRGEPFYLTDSFRNAADVAEKSGKIVAAQSGTHHLQFTLNFGSLGAQFGERALDALSKDCWTGSLESYVALTVREPHPQGKFQRTSNLVLDSWTIAQLEARTIGTATLKDSKDGPTRWMAQGPGSIRLTIPSFNVGSKTGDKATSKTEEAVLLITFQGSMNWQKGGSLQLQNQVVLDFRPQGETAPFHLSCDSLEVRRRTHTSTSEEDWFLLASGTRLSCGIKESLISAGRMEFDPLRNVAVFEKGKEFPHVSFISKNANGAIEGIGERLFLNLSKMDFRLEKPSQPKPPEAEKPDSPSQSWHWDWKGRFSGGVTFIDPQGKPIVQGDFKDLKSNAQNSALWKPFHELPLEFPHYSGQPIDLWVRAPGYEEKVFPNLILEPGVNKKLQLEPAWPAKLRVVSSADGKPLEGAKLLFVGKGSAGTFGSGLLPIEARGNPPWAVTGKDGVARVDSLMQWYLPAPKEPAVQSKENAGDIDPGALKREVGYLFYIVPPPGFAGRIVSVKAGKELGDVLVGPGVQVRGEIRGTKEELDHFLAEWHQPEFVATSPGQTRGLLHPSKVLITQRKESHLEFTLPNLLPGKLRIVGNFNAQSHWVTKPHYVQDLTGSDKEYLIDLVEPITKVILTPNGHEIVKQTSGK